MKEQVREVSSADYTAVRNGGAGIIDLSTRARFLVSGSEAVTFLNGLITNDMKTLSVNSWMAAAFPNVQGRLLAAIRVIHTDDGFLIDTESATHDVVLKLLERFTLAGDFHVADITSEIAHLSVQGKRAAAVISATLGDDAMKIERQEVIKKALANSEATIIRATHTAEDGFDLFIDANHADQLSESLKKGGAQLIGVDVVETLRIEAGIPRYGIDMDETNVVTETNLDDAVSFTKGCYLGQEIIARIQYRGHVAKKLTGVQFKANGPITLERGAKIHSLDDKEIGRVTSITFSPGLGRVIALGYVKYDYLKPGTKVKAISSDKEFTPEIAELPFVCGSWYQNQ